MSRTHSWVSSALPESGEDSCSPGAEAGDVLMVTVTHTAIDTQDEGSRLTGEQPSPRGGRPGESLLASLCPHGIFMGCVTVLRNTSLHGPEAREAEAPDLPHSHSNS